MVLFKESYKLIVQMIKPNQTGALLSMMMVNLSIYEAEILLPLMVEKNTIIFAAIILGLNLGMLQLPHFCKTALRSVF